MNENLAFKHIWCYFAQSKLFRFSVDYTGKRRVILIFYKIQTLPSNTEKWTPLHKYFCFASGNEISPGCLSILILRTYRVSQRRIYPVTILLFSTRSCYTIFSEYFSIPPKVCSECDFFAWFVFEFTIRVGYRIWRNYIKTVSIIFSFCESSR